MPTADGPVNPDPPKPRLALGQLLRALRRHADLSQRQLAELAGVPATTVARIESGRVDDPRIRTVERLVTAARGVLAIGAQPALDDVTPTPFEARVDEAGRRYPAHLDVREVRSAKDWWGAWWADWYDLPYDRWPVKPPQFTYDLSRDRRDDRRRHDAGRLAAAALEVRPATAPDAPPQAWQWVAWDRTGTVVGVLRALRGPDAVRLCAVEVAPAWQRLGVGRRLVDALVTAAAEADLGLIRALAEDGTGAVFLTACGFRYEPPQPMWFNRAVPPRWQLLPR